MDGRLPLGTNPRNGKPYKAIVTDDSAMMRKLLGQILRSEGFDIVAEFETGEKTLEFYEELNIRPEFAFVDVEMPGINGIETVTRLKNLDPELRYIMCTGVTDSAVVKELLRLGISGYIVKPFDRDKVLERLEPAMRGK